MVYLYAYVYTYKLFVLYFGQLIFPTKRSLPTESSVTKDDIKKLPDTTHASKSLGHITPEAPFLRNSIYHMYIIYISYGFTVYTSDMDCNTCTKILVYQVNWANSEATGLSLDEDLLSRTIRIANTNIALCFCVQKYGLGEFGTGRFHIPINIILMYI